MTEQHEGRTPELRPEILFIFDLVKQLVDGRIRIPRFQRPFVWRRQQMIDLLDSIRNQYPIGSLLAWETEAELRSIESVGPVSLTADSRSRYIYLLDGHQRLSTIAGALVSAGDRSSPAGSDDPGIWSIYYNAREDQFEHVETGSELAEHFPMSSILDTFEFLKASQNLLAADEVDGPKYIARVQGVARAFQNYKIPVIEIRQTGLNEAVEIFARLNSKGQSMTADQMVSALLYRDGQAGDFDLAEEISALSSRLILRGFGELDRTLLLRALLAAVGEDIYRTDWTRIAIERRVDLMNRLQGVIPSVGESLERTCDFLRDRLGVRTVRLLPYSMQFVVISSFFFAQKNPSEKQLRLIERWFWVTSFAAWFGGANPSRVNALVRDVIDKVAPETGSPSFSEFDLETPARPLPAAFDMRSARTRALLLVLISLQPRARNGELIAHPDEFVHDLGPDALGYVISSSPSIDLRKSPVNRFLREREIDRRQAKAWMLDLDPSVANAVWESHAFPTAAQNLLEQGDSNAFLEARLRLLQDIEIDFMRQREVVPPLSGEPAPAPADWSS